MGDEQVRQHYDALSAVYDRERHQRFFLEGVEKYLELIGSPPGRVLEVGCGTGGYVAELRRRGIDAFGVDFSPAMVEVARAKVAALGLDPQATVRCADVEETIGFTGPFDAVVAMDCWEFFPHPEKVVGVVAAALRPGGRLVVFTPNQRFDWFLTGLERLRIKKLRPAFMYRNSSLRRLRQLTAPAFRPLATGTLYLGLERWFAAERLPA